MPNRGVAGDERSEPPECRTLGAHFVRPQPPEENRDSMRQRVIDAAEGVPEAPVGFEPTMADLQSAALATWLRRHQQPQLMESEQSGQEE